MAAVNPQQAQQLQKQQTILQQLNQQFEQQQTILQGEIQRQTTMLQAQQQQQQQNNPLLSSATGGGPKNNFDLNGLSSGPKGNDKGAKATGKSSKSPKSPQKKKKSSKRSSTDTDSDTLRPSKMKKTGSAQDNMDKSGKNMEKPTASGTNPGTAAGMAKKSPEGGATTTTNGSSLIPTMPIPAIEQHLESLSSDGQLTPRQIARKCIPLAKKLINHDHGWVFKDPVDPVELGIPDYFEIVEHPMDLTLVVNKLEEGAYKDVGSFEHDTKLVFENAILFNGDDSDVGAMAKELLCIFANDLTNAMKGEA